MLRPKSFPERIWFESANRSEFFQYQFLQEGAFSVSEAIQSLSGVTEYI